MKSAIDRCIDAAERLAMTQENVQVVGETFSAARVELANLQAEVEAAHKYQDTVYKRIMPVVCLWQLETGSADRWPDLVVLIDWLRVRGDKALAELKEEAKDENQ